MTIALKTKSNWYVFDYMCVNKISNTDDDHNVYHDEKKNRKTVLIACQAQAEQ